MTTTYNDFSETDSTSKSVLADGVALPFALSRIVSEKVGCRDVGLWGHPAIAYAGSVCGTGSTKKVWSLTTQGMGLLSDVDENGCIVDECVPECSPCEIEVVRKGCMASLSGLLQCIDNPTANLANYAAHLVSLAGNTWVSLVAAAMGDFTDAIDSSGVQLTLDDILEAYWTLKKRCAGKRFIAFLSPCQVKHLRASARAEGNTVLEHCPDIKNLVLGGAYAGDEYPAQYVGTLEGVVDIFQVAGVPDDGAGNAVGGMFAYGAIAYADGSEGGQIVKLEYDRNAACDRDSVYLNYYFGVSVCDPDAGTRLISLNS